MKTFSEWLDTQPIGLFEAINDVQELPWNTTVNSTELDDLYLMTFGKYFVPSEIEKSTVYQVATSISILYNYRWEQLFEAFNINYPLNQEYQTTLVETIDNSEIGNNSSEVTNLESAYNAETFVNVAKNQMDVTQENDSSKVRDVTETHTSMETLYKNVNRFRSVILFEEVCRDVKNFVSLKIF